MYNHLLAYQNPFPGKPGLGQNGDVDRKDGSGA